MGRWYCINTIYKRWNKTINYKKIMNGVKQKTFLSMKKSQESWEFKNVNKYI